MKKLLSIFLLAILLPVAFGLRPDSAAEALDLDCFPRGSFPSTLEASWIKKPFHAALIHWGPLMFVSYDIWICRERLNADGGMIEAIWFIGFPPDAIGLVDGTAKQNGWYRYWFFPVAPFCASWPDPISVELAPAHGPLSR